LADDLSGPGPFTVFAPTDAAFAALPAGTVDALLQDPTGDLANILLYHVLGLTALSTDLVNGMMVPTLQGDDVTVTINGSDVFINDAQVTVADIIAENGVVHVIDAVLLPPAPQPTNTVVDVIVNSPDHTLLETAVIAAGLAGALSGDGPFTVFAPTDAAFNALPADLLTTLLSDPMGDLTDILLYHVVQALALSTDLSSGQVITTMLGQDITVTVDMNGVMINNAMVTVADIPADNGVVHVIDAVLIPELAPEPTTVVDIIVNSPVHETLETAVIAAGLADDLSAAGPFTVFAPTDDAFAMLPTDLLTALLNDPTGDLASVLLYHVVGAQALSTDLMNGDVIETLLGQDVTVTIDMNGVMINNAMVVVADIMADNGVVHVIDAVLIPELAPLPITVVDIIVNSADHNTLETAVIAAGLAGALSGDGPFTVFAPTDAAFAALPAGALDALLADPTGALADVLLYHVVGGLALSTDLSDGQVITTLLGEDITVTIDMNGVMINNAMVVVADITADNGVVHVIDAVLLPPAQPTNTILDIVVNSEVHNTLEAAVLAAGLEGALAGPGPYTVFAPTDAAFAALPAGTLDALLADPTGLLTQVLLYHAVAGAALSTSLSDGQMIATLQGQDVTVTITGGNVFINDAQVIVADIIADNGVVHVIDAVLVPQSNPLPETVVDIIVNSPVHTVLETAVIAAELADDLSGTGPFTVFAPTDNAFAALPAGTLDALLADPTGALAQVLLYHVVAGEALSSSLTNGQTIATLQGQNVTVSITGGNVFINDAQVIMADIMADNGVVHVIDAILTPSTSVNETAFNNTSIYPNPASEQLTVSVPALSGNATYSIYSSTGSLVTTGLFTTATTTLNVDMLSQGMYQVKINNGSECVTRTFMKK
jgi:uncharacterized surface protein with fasciclin (FAS1) repeats